MHAGLLAWIGYRQSPTLDEVAHLPAGISHWRFGRFELYCVNPPLVRLLAATPVLLTDAKTDWKPFTDVPYSRAEVAIGSRFSADNGLQGFWYLTLARWACIPLSMIGGYVCYCWSKELYGTKPAILTVLLWCVSPNILGNASLITPDAGAAAIGVTAGYFYWCWLKKPHWRQAIWAGLALGAAELTKFTWIILFVLWPILWLGWMLISLRSRQSASPDVTQLQESAERSPRCRQLVIILLLGLYVLNLGYGFEGTFTPLGQYQFVSRALGGCNAHQVPGNRLAETWFQRIPIPVPRNYLRGVDLQRYDFERQKWSYLRGEQRFGGWWYWYLYALCVKVPVGIWVLGLVPIAFSVRKTVASSIWRDEFVLLSHSIFLFILVSSQTGFSRYFRYVLPAFPFCLIWLSQSARVLDRRRPVLSACVTLAIVWSIVSSLLVYPHSISYFNELAGGPKGGPEHLLDANIDWGQDLFDLKRWYDSNPDARPFHLKYFGAIEPSLAGIDSLSVPWLTHRSTGVTNEKLKPGWYAISVNDLYGYKHYDEADNKDYRYLLRFSPIATAGYSIYIYQLSAEDIATIETARAASQ